MSSFTDNFKVQLLRFMSYFFLVLVSESPISQCLVKKYTAGEHNTVSTSTVKGNLLY